MKSSTKKVHKYEYTLMLSAWELKALDSLVDIIDWDCMDGNEKYVAKEIHRIVFENKKLLEEEVEID